jgi:hypothetical protein
MPRDLTASSLLLRHYCVVQPVVREPPVTLDACIAQRGVFVAAEREDGLVHVLGVEHLEPHEQVEVISQEIMPGAGAALSETNVKCASRACLHLQRQPDF